jgi:hypothetical protein
MGKLMATMSDPAKDERFVIVYDTDLRRPACVLLQAAMGGDLTAFRRFFGSSSDWLVAPTPGMKRIRGTAEEWVKVSAG